MLDHLVYAAPDVEAAAHDLAARLGVEPGPGGVHQGFSTRNRLLRIAPDAYLEIVGPDPDQPAPDGPRWFGIDDLTEPRLVTWAVAVPDPAARAHRQRVAGRGPGPRGDKARTPAAPGARGARPQT
ncbi:MAG: VOC family protein, partial [Acidobacteriota bacterium]